MHILFSNFPGRSLAYLDPGSGSFLIQMLLAALLGAGFLIKAYWQKIKNFFEQHFSKSSDDDIQDDN